jgi:hypothetical protein
MRKVIFILLAFYLFSCNRDTGCFECKTTITVTIKDSEESYSHSVSDIQAKCDLSEDEIREYERNNTGASSYTNGSLRFDTVMVTVCTK